MRVLKANVPGVKDPELIFRTRCAAGLLNWLVLAPVGAELRNKSERQIERWLVPVLAGTFRGASTAEPSPPGAAPNNSSNCLTRIALAIFSIKRLIDLYRREHSQQQEAL